MNVRQNQILKHVEAERDAAVADLAARFGVTDLTIRRDRQFLHARVTPHPTAAWTAQQIRETFPFDESPRHILRDNYSVYGADFSRAAPNLGIKEVRTAKGSPWQNPFVERVVGSIRLECTNL